MDRAPLAAIAVLAIAAAGCASSPEPCGRCIDCGWPPCDEDHVHVAPQWPPVEPAPFDPSPAIVALHEPIAPPARAVERPTLSEPAPPAPTLVLAPPAGPSPFAGKGDPRMQRANDLAALVLKWRLAREHPQDLAALRAGRREDVVVVRGFYDWAEDVLGALGVPHVVVAPERVKTLDLEPTQLVLVNCPGAVGREGAERLRRFVLAGGHLVTTDWALVNIIEPAFPGYLRFTGRTGPEEVVAVRARAGDSALLRNLELDALECHRGSPDPRWWIEEKSFLFEVASGDAAVLLATDGERAVAASFPYGDGRVVHLLSHFYLQRPETQAKRAQILVAGVAAAPEVGDAYAAQRLSANTVIEKRRSNDDLLRLYGTRVTTGGVLKLVPGEGGGSSGQIEPGLRVRVLERTEAWDGATGGPWIRVRTFRGEEGWLPEELLGR